MRDETEVRLPNVRLYPGLDDDLITWLDALEDSRHGGKSQAIKNLLRQGLNLPNGLRGVSSPAAPLDSAVLLGDIRRVVDDAARHRVARRRGWALVAWSRTSHPSHPPAGQDRCRGVLTVAVSAGPEPGRFPFTRCFAAGALNVASILYPTNEGHYEHPSHSSTYQAGI
jgi:hypothetical protein